MGEMTITELQALTHDALNELAAGCMWTKAYVDGDTWFWVDREGHTVELPVSERGNLYNCIPDFTGSENPYFALYYVSLLEAEIARRGSSAKVLYVQALAKLLSDRTWVLITASPHLRTVAAVLTLQGEEK